MKITTSNIKGINYAAILAIASKVNKVTPAVTRAEPWRAVILAGRRAGLDVEKIVLHLRLAGARKVSGSDVRAWEQANGIAIPGNSRHPKFIKKMARLLQVYKMGGATVSIDYDGFRDIAIPLIHRKTGESAFYTYQVQDNKWTNELEDIKAMGCYKVYFTF